MSRWPHRRKSQDKTPFQVILDQFSIQDIERATKLRDRFLRFHWDFYSSLAYQRAQIADDLRRVLSEAAERSYQFPRWQRVIGYKYALQPLSTAGSLADPGGRFNIGEIDTTNFHPFPALYVAADRHTALQEVLCQSVSSGQESRAWDSALLRPNSTADISLSGSLTSVINLKHPSSLGGFVNLIKCFSMPSHLTREAKAMKLDPPEIVRDIPKLLQVLLAPNWRVWPMQFDVPAVSQLFGQLVAEAGIEAILYRSKFSGNDCLAIFPQNFGNSDAYVQLDDTSPPGVQVSRLDGATWRALTQPPQS